MGKIRIIGGTHRSRMLNVVDAEGLRPTLDRIKTTLFNWLGNDLTGLTVLDLFAGSGSLGFEAVSRGAKHVTCVEKNHLAYKQLQENKKILKVDNIDIIHIDALDFLKHNKKTFDVIFLDPPFQSALLEQSLQQIIPHLSSDAVIYIETAKEMDLSKFEVLKESKTKSLCYRLIRLSSL